MITPPFYLLFWVVRIIKTHCNSRRETTVQNMFFTCMPNRFVKTSSCFKQHTIRAFPYGISSTRIMLLGFGSGRRTSVCDCDRREVAFRTRNPIFYPTAQTFHIYKKNKLKLYKLARAPGTRQDKPYALTCGNGIRSRSNVLLRVCNWGRKGCGIRLRCHAGAVAVTVTK